MTAQTLPDNPSCCFVPAYDIKDEVQQIRIVIEGMAGQVPTALVALTVICCAQHLMDSFASRASALGEGLPTIGTLLGHTHVQTSARYAYLARDTVRASAARIGDSIDNDLDAPWRSASERVPCLTK